MDCTKALRTKLHPQDPNWTVEHGDVLDRSYVDSLGQFDVVYSWAVLHHTGNMWQALENLIDCVRSGGNLLISIYNDTGRSSRVWKVEKRLYAASPRLVQFTAALAYTAFWELAFGAIQLTQGKNPLSRTRWRTRKGNRGMSLWHDNIDWLGGYPFEYARPDKVFAFFHHRGFVLDLTTTPSNGCNEYVFARPALG